MAPIHEGEFALSAFLAILGVSFAGLNSVARIKAILGWLAISAALATLGAGGGYLIGRMDGSSICAANAARANAAIRENDDTFQTSVEDFNTATIVETAKAENHNEGVNAKLTAREPHDGNLCLSGQWLRDLSTLK